MDRFFVPDSLIVGDSVILDTHIAHQIVRVLRLTVGDEVTILDNSGYEHCVCIRGISRGIVEGNIIYTRLGNREPTLNVTLYQGILKGEKFEWILQKGTELGASRFVPVICSRSIPRNPQKWCTNKYSRWTKIVSEASEQSGRSRLPIISEALSFGDACLEAATSRMTSIIPWEREVENRLGQVIRGINSDSINIFIGPEGGFEESEISLACSKGIVPISISHRTLRSETAAISTLAIIFHELENQGGG